MTEQEFKNIVAGNLAKYRKSVGLTQAQLAEKLSYTDKAVSKWERGESLPDVYLLFRIGEVLGVSLGELTSETSASLPDRTVHRKKTHLFITLLSVGLVWLVMAIGFFALKFFNFSLFEPALLFLYAVPVSFIVLIVLTCIWWGIPSRAVAVSGLVWTVAVSVFVTFARFQNISNIFIIAAILQVLTVLWFALQTHIRNNRKR